MMADPRDPDVMMGEDYNESEDSDFVEDAVEDVSSDSDEGKTLQNGTAHTAAKSRKSDGLTSTKGDEVLGELDSGDEATIRETAKAKRKAKKNGNAVAKMDSDEEEDQGWRAKTRAMREKEKDERKQTKLATVKGSTIDVDAIGKEMNRPGNTLGLLKSSDPKTSLSDDKATQVAGTLEETITIKRTYRFAGELKTEEKVVPKSSAEAQLWLAQQERAKKKADTAVPPAIEGSDSSDARPLNRPLRYISRFDPNYNNLDAFKRNFGKSTTTTTTAEQKGPKLNVVEKSKMDWAAHVDSEGLKDELDTAARAKGGYLGRMDFLSEVEARKDAEAREARQKG